MKGNQHTGTAVEERELTPQDIERHFNSGYHEIEILPDGTLRETIGNGEPRDEQVTRSLKTERTWY
jgi:hypothetical protein